MDPCTSSIISCFCTSNSLPLCKQISIDARLIILTILNCSHITNFLLSSCLPSFEMLQCYVGKFDVNKFKDYPGTVSWGITHTKGISQSDSCRESRHNFPSQCIEFLDINTLKCECFACGISPLSSIQQKLGTNCLKKSYWFVKKLRNSITSHATILK